MVTRLFFNPNNQFKSNFFRLDVVLFFGLKMGQERTKKKSNNKEEKIFFFKLQVLIFKIFKTKKFENKDEKF
jgi:hypothetical protein